MSNFKMDIEQWWKIKLSPTYEISKILSTYSCEVKRRNIYFKDDDFNSEEDNVPLAKLKVRWEIQDIENTVVFIRWEELAIKSERPSS